MKYILHDAPHGCSYGIANAVRMPVVMLHGGLCSLRCRRVWLWLSLQQ